MITTDNNQGFEMSDDERLSLTRLAKYTIKELCSDDVGEVLVFPHSFGEYGDDLEKNKIFDIKGSKLYTNNIMGFIGYKGCSITIRSRFTNDENDYFLHYMLQKVFSLNLFSLDTTFSNESIFDLLCFIFPHFLNKAMKQGLFKEYQTRHYNDSHVRGRIDVNRHIRENIPFVGNIAYDNREFQYDNHITELIRHTIEFINNKDYGNEVLSADSETIDNIRLIREATTLYKVQDRDKIVYANIRPVVHPYFSEYRDLQRICLMILKQEELKYGGDNRQIHGILFDGAWLWEEYLSTILKRLGFKHPQNKIHKGRLWLYQKEPEKKNRGCYPDFYKDDFVLDAKYKGYGKSTVSGVSREDTFQVISYMWLLRAHHGGFIFPMRKNENADDVRVLKGYDGQLALYGLHVDHSAETYSQFCERMEREEELLIKRIDSNVK